jgi:NADH-quinone oxidoreductase subunit A
MPELVGYLLLFLVVGAGFILIHLLVGKLIRPAKPHDEKLTIYECGEPTIGSAWVQFDVRFYVVALLFVIFDVEVAFFFPWAVVFGSLTELAQPNLPQEKRLATAYTLETQAAAEKRSLEAKKQELLNKKQELAKSPDGARQAQAKQIAAEVTRIDNALAGLDASALESRAAAHHLAWIALLDLAVFFGVLLVGFAYLWRRGDVQWVRSTAAEQPPAVEASVGA